MLSKTEGYDGNTMTKINNIIMNMSTVQNWSKTMKEELSVLSLNCKLMWCTNGLYLCYHIILSKDLFRQTNIENGR